MSDIIQRRRSIRKFKPNQTVSKEQLNRLLEAAMLAPSACNSRPWEFVVITRREKLDEIARVHPFAKMCETATAAIVVVALPQNGIPEGFFPQDCAAATQNILLEAVNMGLGTCWCGVYPKRSAAFSSLFDIRSPKIPFNVIAIGVPDEEPTQRGFFDATKVTYLE